MPELKANPSLNRTISLSITMKLLSALGLFIISTLLAKNLGAEGFGMYAILLSAASIISIPLSSGLPVLLTRETARLSTQRTNDLWKGLLLFAICLVTLVSLLGGGGIFLYLNLSNSILNQNTTYLTVLIFIVPLMGLDKLRGSVMQGLGSSLISQIPESLIKPYSYLFFILIGIYYLNNFNLGYVISSYIISTILSFFIGSLLLKRLISNKLKGVKPKFEFKKWTISLFSLGVLSASQILVGNADILILGFLGSISDVGIYKVALQGLALMMVTQTGVSAVLSAKLSQGFARNDFKNIIAVSDFSTFIFTGVMLIATCTVFYFGNFFIELFFGVQYSLSIKILLILALGQIVNSITGPTITLLVMSNNEKSALKSIFSGAITMLLLSVFLTPIYGAEGMAIASTTGVVITNITMALLTRKHLNFNPTVLGALTRLKN